MNFDEIVVKESPGICRCCLSEGCYKDLGSEYIWMNEAEVYADMLLDCFDIGITQHSDGPNGAKRLICEVCITRLRDACNFKKQVLDSEKRFIDMLGRGEFRSKMVLFKPPMELKVESIEEPPEDVMAEDVEYLDDMEYEGNEEDVKVEGIQSTSRATTSENRPLKRGRPKKDSSPTKAKRQKTVKDRTSDQSATAERFRNNLKILFNHTTIIPFKWNTKYACFYCGETITDYSKLRNHTKSHGLSSKKIIKRKINRELLIDISEIVCEICQTRFQSRGAVVDHLIGSHCKKYDVNVNMPFQEYNLRDLKCPCDQQFSTFQMLVNHVRESHLTRFECNDCSRWFSKAEDIIVHIRTCHGPRFACVTCREEFVDGDLLKEHNRRAHLQLCTLCDAKFVFAGSLKKHITKEHPGNSCKISAKLISSVVEMKVLVSNCKSKNQTSMHDGSELSDKRLKRNAMCNQIRRNIQCVLNMSTAVPFKFKGNFSCFYCSQWFTNFDELIPHTRAEHPICELKSKAMQTCKGEKSCIKLDINGLACKLCQQPMNDLKTFVDHVVGEHKADYDKTVPFKDCFEAFQLTQGKIPCPECQKPFAYFATLLKHLGAEHNHHKAVCAYCGRGFRTTTSLAMHITNSHTGTCECTICNAKCKNSAALSRHMARFHDAKDFKCSQCPELFETIYKKQNHLIKAHNVGHKCGYCEKIFTRNSFMMNHVRRTHLKERTVPCSVCHVKFFDSYHMRLHMVKHEGMRRFRCDVCGKSFLRVRNLKSHMDTHKKGYTQEGV